MIGPWKLRINPHLAIRWSDCTDSLERNPVQRRRRVHLLQDRLAIFHHLRQPVSPQARHRCQQTHQRGSKSQSEKYNCHNLIVFYLDLALCVCVEHKVHKLLQTELGLYIQTIDMSNRTCPSVACVDIETVSGSQAFSDAVVVKSKSCSAPHPPARCRRVKPYHRL